MPACIHTIYSTTPGGHFGGFLNRQAGKLNPTPSLNEFLSLNSNPGRSHYRENCLFLSATIPVFVFFFTPVVFLPFFFNKSLPWGFLHFLSSCIFCVLFPPQGVLTYQTLKMKTKQNNKKEQLVSYQTIVFLSDILVHTFKYCIFELVNYQLAATAKNDETHHWPYGCFLGNSCLLVLGIWG